MDRSVRIMGVASKIAPVDGKPVDRPYCGKIIANLDVDGQVTHLSIGGLPISSTFLVAPRDTTADIKSGGSI